MTEQAMALLCRGLDQLGLPWTQGAAEQLSLYGDRLLEKNQVMNLTAITDPEEVVKRHFLDSAALLPSKALGGRKVIDVGTGAGFPGLVLKILDPTIQLTLLDSLGKRVDWLGQVAETLGLEGVTPIHARAEEQAQVKGFRDGFDFATARAVAELRLLCELCLPFVKVGGLFLAMKSVDSDRELEDAAHCIKLLGGRLEQPVDYAIPGSDVTHRVIPIRKVAPTLKGYPGAGPRFRRTPCKLGAWAKIGRFRTILFQGLVFSQGPPCSFVCFLVTFPRSW